jgi:hypothetical protein
MAINLSSGGMVKDMQAHETGEEILVLHQSPSPPGAR